MFWQFIQLSLLLTLHNCEGRHVAHWLRACGLTNIKLQYWHTLSPECSAHSHTLNHAA